MLDYTIDPNTENKKNIMLLTSKGIGTPCSPNGEATEFPINIADLPSDTLHNLLAEYTAWMVYADYLESIATVEVTTYKTLVEHAQAKAYFLAPGNNVTDKREAKHIDDDVVLLQDKLLKSQARQTHLASQKKRFESYSFTISRRLSTMQAENRNY
jgi:hypothetical protein